MKERIKIEIDKFNSKIFRNKFGNVVDYAKDIKSDDIFFAIKNSVFDYFAVKIDSKDTTAIYHFQKAGFYLVDALLTYEFDSEKAPPLEEKYSCDFKSSVDENDVFRLAEIASRVFKIDRFHSDPNLDSKLCDNYYYQWVINSFHGFADGAIVPFVDNKVVAFTTYRINNIDKETSTMVLSAVDPDYMGLGIYQNMIRKGTIELLKFSKKIRVGTQVDNVPVQRTWQKLGYKLIDVKYIFHFKR